MVEYTGEAGVYRVEAEELHRGVVRAIVTLVVDGVVVFRDRITPGVARDRVRFANQAPVADDCRAQMLADLLALDIFLAERATATPPPAAEAEPVDPTRPALLDRPDLLDAAAEAVRAGGMAMTVELERLVMLLVIVTASRRLPRPINCVLEGQSSAGKTYVVQQVVALLPAGAIVYLSGMSEKALAYTESELSHRYLFIAEAAAMSRDGAGASLIRSLVWDNAFVYETVEKSRDGKLVARRIERPGPTGLLTTSTKALEPELATRVLALPVPEDEATTRAILRATARWHRGERPTPPDLAGWRQAMAWLDQYGAGEVTVPYADALADAFPARAVRSRRDFGQLLTLIEAHALLHQANRATDEAGGVLADRRDYDAVYALSLPIFGAIVAGGVTPAIRATVAAVTEALDETRLETVGLGELALRLDLHRTTTQRRVNRALAQGHLVNDEHRFRQPMKLRLGEPLPEPIDALPHPDTVFGTTPEDESVYPPRTSAQVHKSAEMADLAGDLPYAPLMHDAAADAADNGANAAVHKSRISHSAAPDGEPEAPYALMHLRAGDSGATPIYSYAPGLLRCVVCKARGDVVMLFQGADGRVRCQRDATTAPGGTTAPIPGTGAPA